ncbi:hypothetical protein WPS_05170 [Vulcanimicrobium alpinum]|uniref:Calcineurin-like phosphoesterase domain-containing protein n=1 Tax=Vulcanimicrobium alpinum TaxID=3016050 RepID=A0AAN1XVL2_UNVUL|nr:hypothetical protein WPS_05170 [Vulcanimicrobium alpinum]
MRLAIASDTHLRHAAVAVPDGDVFVHCGDLCGKQSSLEEVRVFGEWARALPHRHKIVIAGNHDFPFERMPEAARAALGEGIIYLQDAGVTIGGLRFWGSPWQPRFFDWAFNLDRGEPLRVKWAQIPADTDVLITHGPPRGILDATARGDAAGCDDLLARVHEVRPRVHCFGHIHEAAGIEERSGTIFVNASICTLRYAPSNPVRVVDIDAP